TGINDSLLLASQPGEGNGKSAQWQCNNQKQSGEGEGEEEEEEGEDSLHVTYEQSIRVERNHVLTGDWVEIDCNDADPGSGGGQACTGSVVSDVDKEKTTLESEVLRLLFLQLSNGAGDSTESYSHVGERHGTGADPLLRCPTLDQFPGPSGAGNERSVEVLVFKQRAESLRNMYNDKVYFTASFPTLFWTGAGGHLEN
ncbi:hypothetical protein Q9L58_010393, partial [Maublancomyces gigas]